MSAENLNFRFARPDECDVILDLVKQLAEYEKLLDCLRNRYLYAFMRLHRDAIVVIEKKLADEIGYRG